VRVCVFVYVYECILYVVYVIESEYVYECVDVCMCECMYREVDMYDRVRMMER